MGNSGELGVKKRSWILYLMTPFALPAALLVMIPLGILALLSIPYFAVFPDHQAHLYDFEGTGHQRERLCRWRALYKKMNVLQRIERSMRKRQRRKLRSR